MRYLSIAVVGVVTTVLGFLGVAVVRTHFFARRSIRRPPAAAQTAVVFGTQALADRPGPVLQARLDHAIALYRRGDARRIAIAGGVPPFHDGPSGGHDEVAVGLAYAGGQGIPAEHLIAVRPGQNTREQVASTKRRVWDEGLGPITAVSSSYHLLRIAREARRRGFAVEPSAPPRRLDTVTWRNYLSHLVVDTVAVIWYALPAGASRRIDTSAGTFRHLVLLAMRGDVAWRLAWQSLRRLTIVTGEKSAPDG